MTKYKYSDQLNSQSISEESILLPVDTLGKPDWAYMDAYMRSVMDDTENALSAMQSIG